MGMGRGRSAKALKDSINEFLQIIEAWAAAKRLDAFIADAECRVQEFPDEQRHRAMEHLRRANELIGSTDALVRFGGWRAPDEQ